MHIRSTRRALPAALMLLALAASAATLLTTDPAKSSVSATFKQMGVPVEAKFKKFTAQIVYNPAAPDASTAKVDIEVGSFDLGDADMNTEVLKKEWFNAAQYPKASFASSAIQAGPAGKLTVTGKLSIKGKAANVSFPLSVKNEAGKQVFEGALPIKRLAFNIGDGEWRDTGTVADEVIIKFRVTVAQ